MCCTKAEQLGAKRELWIRCLDGDDLHSIMRQIHRMLWNTAAFRLVNEARRIAPRAEDGGAQANGLMHGLLDEGFFEGQMLAIRRLTDTYPISGTPPNRDVFSLTSLLKDMWEHAPLMTRENLFAVEGREYDVDAVRKRCEEYERQRMRNGERGCWIPQDLDWHRLEERHREVDLLAGVTDGKRAPDDAIRAVVMQKLTEKLSASCNDLHTYTNKFIAHAATPGSRRKVDANGAVITLGRLYEAHEAICKVANFVGRYLLTGTSQQMLPVPQYDTLAYIDKPLVSGEDVNILRETWADYDRETHLWTAWDLEEFRQECAL